LIPHVYKAIEQRAYRPVDIRDGVDEVPGQAAIAATK
jgi:hypothetical protein